MIRLYHCVSARSFRAVWALEELGLPYELVMLPFPPRQHARAFLEINPLGTIPLLVHGDTRMTESVAICQYLCALVPGTPLELRRGDAEYGSFLNMLHFGEATLTFPQTLVLRYSRFEPEDRRQPSVAEDYAKWFLARLRTLELRLTRESYLCAGRFTAADISVGYALMLADFIGLAPGSRRPSRRTGTAFANTRPISARWMPNTRQQSPRAFPLFRRPWAGGADPDRCGRWR